MADGGRTPTHWADEAAAAVLGRRAQGDVVVCTGISPSGPFHVGHLREIITGDALARSVRDAGGSAHLVFVVDNLDPLRKVYPFLDDATYRPLVGRPLTELPAPDGAAGRYDEHFLQPFLRALARLRVDAEVVRASELYGSGRMDEVVLAALEKQDLIARIVEEVTGRSVGEGWSPWNPQCEHCGRLDRGKVVSFNREDSTVVSDCEACGSTSRRPIRAGGKLTWRVDWAARWKVLQVALEPFGKDHASRGGSYDTGKRLARDVFGIEPPDPLVYEWIALRGAGDMSSSRGNVLEVSDLVRVVPPEVLRYVVLKARPTRTISFDPGLPLLRLVDEVDDASASGRDDRALELSRANGFRPVGVPFHHLVLVSQIAGFDVGRTLEILESGGYGDLDREGVGERVEMARAWLDRYAPDDARVVVPDQLPEAALSLEPDQRVFLAQLAERLPSISDPVEIHETIRELAQAEGGPGARRGFEAIYRALLGRDRGPRAGTFVALLGPRFVAERIREAAAAGL